MTNRKTALIVGASVASLAVVGVVAGGLWCNRDSLFPTVSASTAIPTSPLSTPIEVVSSRKHRRHRKHRSSHKNSSSALKMPSLRYLNDLEKILKAQNASVMQTPKMIEEIKNSNDAKSIAKEVKDLKKKLDEKINEIRFLDMTDAAFKSHADGLVLTVKSLSKEVAQIGKNVQRFTDLHNLKNFLGGEVKELDEALKKVVDFAHGKLKTLYSDSTAKSFNQNCDQVMGDLKAIGKHFKDINSSIESGLLVSIPYLHIFNWYNKKTPLSFMKEALKEATKAGKTIDAAHKTLRSAVTSSNRIRVGATRALKLSTDDLATTNPEQALLTVKSNMVNIAALIKATLATVESKMSDLDDFVPRAENTEGVEKNEVVKKLLSAIRRYENVLESMQNAAEELSNKDN